MLLGPHRTAPPLGLPSPPPLPSPNRPMAPTLPPSFSPTAPPSHQSRKSGATLWPEPSSTDLPDPTFIKSPQSWNPFRSSTSPRSNLSSARPTLSLSLSPSPRLCSFPRLRGRTLCSQLLGKGRLPLDAHTPRRQGVVASAR